MMVLQILGYLFVPQVKGQVLDPFWISMGGYNSVHDYPSKKYPLALALVLLFLRYILAAAKVYKECICPYFSERKPSS